MRRSFLFFNLLLIGFSTSQAQDSPNELPALSSKIDSVFNTIMEAEHIPGAAYVVVKDGQILLKGGYGYTSLGEAIEEVNPDSTIFRIGSVTKTFTAMAVMQLADEKKLELTAPANNYLKTVKIESSFNRPVTVANLINHSAGFDELPGRRVYDSTQRISLSNFLKDRLEPIREPGIISSYSSYGIALAGLLVEEVSGLSLEAYMKKHIWEPLAMHSTTMQLNETVEENISWGYEYQNGINVPMPWEYYHTYPASDINSTVVDMGKYMMTHLNDGYYEGTQVLSKKAANQMKYPELKVHNKVESFAYGFYEEDVQGFRTVSHGGDMLGYASHLAMVPEENLGIYVVHHHEGTRMRYAIVDFILSLFSTGDKEEDFKAMETTNNLNRFAGFYQWTTFCHTCETGWKPEEHQLVVNGDGTFSIFNRTFFQVEPLLFRSTDGERTMGFVENDKGEIQYMSTGGVNVFEKVK